MTAPDQLIKTARTRAGLTQAQLARRLRTSQSAIARLETPGSNPRLATLERALDACGRDLDLASRPRPANVDETLIAKQLRRTPWERLRGFELTYADLRKLALAGQQSRGELG
jgi:transcriptional regulator with XRE-family HTH domain